MDKKQQSNVINVWGLANIGCTMQNPTFQTLVLNDGEEQSEETNATNPQVTDQRLADAISSINGKGKVLNEYQKWLGVCCYVSARCGYPMNLEACCQRLANLPYKTALEYVPQYKSIRVYASWNFVKAGYDQWPTLKVNDQERNLFIKCHDTALALENALNMFRSE